MAFKLGVKVERKKWATKNYSGQGMGGWVHQPFFVRRIPPALLPVNMVGGMSAPRKVDPCSFLKKTKNSQPSVTVFLSFLWETFSIIQIQHCQMNG